MEIGVVQVGPDGEVADHWGTLVNPQRDIGPTQIHGITAAQVLDAPTFEQVAPYLLRAVAGRTLVAHNVRFDLNFLVHELRRVGPDLGPGAPAICTMEWSARILAGSSRKLVDCCAAAGIVHRGVHSAIEDALATAGLLGHYLRVAGAPPPWASVLDVASSYRWPAFADDLPPISMTPRTAPAERPEAWLDKVVSLVTS